MKKFAKDREKIKNLKENKIDLNSLYHYLKNNSSLQWNLVIDYLFSFKIFNLNPINTKEYNSLPDAFASLIFLGFQLIDDSNYLYLEVHYQGPSEEDFDSGLSDDLDFEKLEKKIDPHVIESIKKILNKYKIHAENDALVYSYFYKISLFEFKKYFMPILYNTLIKNHTNQRSRLLHIYFILTRIFEILCSLDVSPKKIKLVFILLFNNINTVEIFLKEFHELSMRTIDNEISQLEKKINDLQKRKDKIYKFILFILTIAITASLTSIIESFFKDQ